VPDHNHFHVVPEALPNRATQLLAHVPLLTVTKKSQVSETSDAARPPLAWAWRALLQFPVKKS